MKCLFVSKTPFSKNKNFQNFRYSQPLHKLFSQIILINLIAFPFFLFAKQFPRMQNVSV
jgi:hypothetical protein